MSSVGQVEKATQNRIFRLFKERLGYEHFGDWIDRICHAKEGGFSISPYIQYLQLYPDQCAHGLFQLGEIRRVLVVAKLLHRSSALVFDLDTPLRSVKDGLVDA